MIRYTVPANGTRSDAYRFSTEDKNCEDIANLRKVTASYNKNLRQYICDTHRMDERSFLKVCIKPRGKRPANSYHTLVKDATHYDVYVWTDYEATRLIAEMLKTGNLASELAEVRRLKVAIRQIEFKGFMRKHAYNETGRSWML